MQWSVSVWLRPTVTSGPVRKTVIRHRGFRPYKVQNVGASRLHTVVFRTTFLYARHVVFVNLCHIMDVVVLHVSGHFQAERRQHVECGLLWLFLHKKPFAKSRFFIITSHMKSAPIRTICWQTGLAMRKLCWLAFVAKRQKFKFSAW